MATLQPYMLATGEAGAQRLRLLEEVYGPGTHALLREVGVGPGSRVADFGCGIGSITSWLARQVGPRGSVVGIDLSAAQLALARTAVGEAPYVRFVTASADETGLDSAAFDVVYCRFLLCHLPDPRATLREMDRLVRPGGWLVVEDVDLASCSTVPATEAYREMVRVMLESGRARGVDYCLGLQMPQMFQELGYRAPAVRFDQPAYFAGEPKRLWEYSFLEAIPALEQAGTIDKEGTARLAAELARIAADPKILVITTRKVQVWGRKGV